MSDRKETIGQGINRVDGILKVTGTAKYATDYPMKNMAHAVLLRAPKQPEISLISIQLMLKNLRVLSKSSPIIMLRS